MNFFIAEGEWHVGVFAFGDDGEFDSVIVFDEFFC